MALSINEVKSGVTVLIDNEVYQVTDVQHVKPGKGAAFARTKLRNMKTGNILEKTFRGDEKIEPAYIDERKLQYLYQSADMYHFTDQDNFEEITIQKDQLGDKIKFLKDNIEVAGYFFKGEVININLPNFIEVKITHTEPGIKGDTAKSGTKHAQIETGATVQVPLFIEVGDKIKVDTRTGSYVEKAY